MEVKEGVNVVQTNEYDGLNRRIVRVDVAASPDVTYDYYYNEEWQLLEERKNGDPDPLAQYVWHPYYIDALAIRYYDDNLDGTSVEQYYLQDANFNVTAVTDNAGSVLERYAYSPYGEVTVLDANFAADADGLSDIGNTHFFTGRERDKETGLQLNRHRYFASHLGRWVTRDDVQYVDSSNLFEYVRGAPAVYLDPDGNLATIDYFHAICVVTVKKCPVATCVALSVTCYGCTGNVAKLKNLCNKECCSIVFCNIPTPPVPVPGLPSLYRRCMASCVAEKENCYFCL